MSVKIEKEIMKIQREGRITDESSVYLLLHMKMFRGKYIIYGLLSGNSIRPQLCFNMTTVAAALSVCHGA